MIILKYILENKLKNNNDVDLVFCLNILKKKIHTSLLPKTTTLEVEIKYKNLNK